MSAHPYDEAARDVVVSLIRSRRTIHLFNPDRPPDQIVERALELARWAPNHRLTEPWRAYLLGHETAEAVATLNAALVRASRGAKAGAIKLERWRRMPGWLVITCSRSEDAGHDLEDYAACCCAVQNMMLYLWSEGIGMKWTTGGVTRDPQFFELLNIDFRKERVVGLFWYGYPSAIPDTPRNSVSTFLFRRP